MAWLGAFVLLGFVLLAFDVVRERVSDRRARRQAELGLPRKQWSRRRRLVTLTAVLVVVLAMIGVVALSRGGNESSSATDKLNVIPKTSSTTTSSSTTTTTLPPGRPPQQVRVLVVNASGVPGAAATKANALGALGYQIAGLANGAARTGTAVQCRADFEKEAAVLAKNVGGTTTVEPFPNPPPAGSASSDCLVVLGT